MPVKPKKANKPQPASKSRSRPKKTAKTVAKTRPGAADNKTVYLKFVEEVLNGGNFSVAPAYLAPGVVTHNGFPGQEPGVEGFIAALKAFHGAFPDLRADMTHVIAEGDRVVGRFEVTGTHRGSFLGMPATGRKVRYEEIAIVRLAEGRIAEHWSVADALAILQQLGMSESG